jgi:hypothetical protein
MPIEEGGGRMSEWWTDEAAEERFRRLSDRRKDARIV